MRTALQLLADRSRIDYDSFNMVTDNYRPAYDLHKE